MFKFTKKDKRTQLKKEMDTVFTRLESLDASSEEYSTAVTNLEKLHKMSSNDKIKINSDVVITVAGAIVSTILVLYFEKTGVVTSKAVNWILKGRV
jgi:hypothetical protein